MRMAVHIIGDMHQPLHTISMIDDGLLNGDEGGNLIQILVNSTQKRSGLHSFWDSGAF
jgi:hypothetical protein